MRAAAIVSVFAGTAWATYNYGQQGYPVQQQPSSVVEVTSTRVATVISCAPSVTDCPAHEHHTSQYYPTGTGVAYPTYTSTQHMSQPTWAPYAPDTVIISSSSHFSGYYGTTLLPPNPTQGVYHTWYETSQYCTSTVIAHSSLAAQAASTGSSNSYPSYHYTPQSNATAPRPTSSPIVTAGASVVDVSVTLAAAAGLVAALLA